MSAVAAATYASVVEKHRATARRPRILYLITRAERGGAQMHVMDLVHGMKHGFEVEVATGEEGFLTDACRQAGVPVHVLPNLTREIRPATDFRGVQEMIQLLRRYRPHLVHAHTFKSGFLGRFAANFLNIPAIYTVHMWPFEPAAPLSWRLAAPLCERLAARWCQRLITVSEVGAREARRRKICPAHKVAPIPNGIADHPARAALNRDQSLSCTMVARFVALKDHETLVRAFAGVPGQPRLTLIGDGPNLASAKKLAADLGIAGRVDFKGARNDVAQLLAQTDIFVLSSKLETLPISILEAMRAGLPVVASDVGGIPEEVEDGVTGLLVPVGSVEGMRQALIKLFSDKNLRMTMGRAGRARFEEQFLASRMIDKTRAVYEHVLSGQRPGA